MSAAVALVVAASLAVGVSAGSGSTTKTKPGVIELGAIIGQSGIYGGIGPSILAGTRVAINDINRAGGIKIKGKKYVFRLKVLDDKSDPQVAVADAVQLIRDDHIKILLGPIALQAISVAPVAAQNHVINITPSSSSQALIGSSNYPYLFSTAPSINFRGAGIIAGIVHWVPKVKRIAVMSPNDASTNQLLPSMQAQAQARGITLQTFTYPAGTADLSTIASKVVAFNPNVVWSEPSNQEVGNVIKQLNAAGLPSNVPVDAYGADLTVAKNAGRPVIVQSIHPYELDTKLPPGVEAFVKRCQRALTPSTATLTQNIFQYSPSIYLLAKAIQKAGTFTDVKKLSKAMAGISGTVWGQKVRWALDHNQPFRIASVFIDTSGNLKATTIKP